MMEFLIGLMIGIWALALGLTLWGTWLSLKHFKSNIPHLDAPFGLFPVSVLKPLSGVDAGLSENIESFFVLDYPEFELIFSVAKQFDPAVAVVQKLINSYPEVPARLIIGDVSEGLNPKVNNMIKSYDTASYDWILISDSNVRVEPDYLRRLVAHVDNGVGLVTSVVAGSAPGGIGGWLEATFLNTFYARGMLVAKALGETCVVGKSMLLSRSVANRFGGIRNLSQYLAEDYMAGKAIEMLGLKVVIARDPIRQHIGRHSLNQFWQRHLRWGRIRKSQAPITFMIEPMLGCLVSGLIGASALSVCGISFFAVLVVHLIAWFLCDFLMLKVSYRECDFRRATLGWVLRELIAVPLWINIAVGRTVKWRGRELRILPGGLLESA